MLPITHFLHLLSAIVWAGGTFFFIFAVQPAMLRLSADQIPGFFDGIRQTAGPLMGTAGVLVIVTGVGQMILRGDVTSWAGLTDSYSLHALTALVIVVAVAGFDGVFRARMGRAIVAGGDFVPRLRSLQRRHSWIVGIGLVLVVLLMSMLGLGIY